MSGFDGLNGGGFGGADQFDFASAQTIPALVVFDLDGQVLWRHRSPGSIDDIGAMASWLEQYESKGWGNNSGGNNQGWGGGSGNDQGWGGGNFNATNNGSSTARDKFGFDGAGQTASSGVGAGGGQTNDSFATNANAPASNDFGFGGGGSGGGQTNDSFATSAPVADTGGGGFDFS